MSDKPLSKAYRLLLAALVASCLLLHLAILWESRQQIAAGYGDFLIFYTGAQIINDGKSRELFKVETQNAYQAKFDVPQLEWPLPFNHAPYELLIFLPLVHFPYPVAHVIWSGINVLLLAIMLRWLLAYVDSPHSFFIAAAVFAWFPTLEAFRMGQDSILSTALLLAVFVALKRRRDGWAGFFLAVGLYKPQLVLPLVGALIVARRWHSLATFCFTGLILIIGSLAMVGLQGASDLVNMLSSMEEHAFVVTPATMPNVRGLFHVIVDGEGLGWFPGAGALAVSIGLYGFSLYLWRRGIDVADPIFDLQFSLILVTTVLISYHLYAHDLFPVTLSLLLLFRFGSSGMIIYRPVSNTFWLILIICFIPFVPYLLIKAKVFGWGAMPFLLLYIILSVEVANQVRKLKHRSFSESQGG